MSIGEGRFLRLMPVVPVVPAALAACFPGTATGEGYATDAVNGTLLWQAVDKRGGTTAPVANTLDNWRVIRHIFEAWGVLLRTRLQQLAVCR